jgi:hypothetical protein
MISRHVDIWAVLLLLFGFALFSRTNQAALRIADSSARLLNRFRTVEVHSTPLRLNRYNRLERRHVPTPCRFI